MVDFSSSMSNDKFFPGPNSITVMIHGTKSSARLAAAEGLERLPAMIAMLVALANELEPFLALSADAFKDFDFWALYIYYSLHGKF